MAVGIASIERDSNIALEYILLKVAKGGLNNSVSVIRVARKEKDFGLFPDSATRASHIFSNSQILFSNNHM